ncbi:MAG: hypothetical protein HY965_02645 [Ignavibacteriales bacterium]|nr:hypothetical protein [Ignavibacteriales bacterium]
METHNTRDSAKEFFNGFEENSGRILLFHGEMLALIEHGYEKHKLEALHDITFSAKSINGMKRAVQNAVTNPEVKNADALKKDLSLEIGKLMERLGAYIADTDESFGVHFTSGFLEMNPQSFINLTNLLSDLEQLKIYFNRLKQSERENNI